MGDYEDVVNALRALGEVEGWERPGRAFAEAVQAVWEQRYLHARKLRSWVSLPREEALPLPRWAKTLSERLDHAEIFQADDGAFWVMAHLYALGGAGWMQIDQLCRKFEVQWRITAQSWHFPSASLLVEIAPNVENLPIFVWHGILNKEDDQMAQEMAERNRKRIHLVRPPALEAAQEREERLSKEERRKRAAIRRMEAHTLLQEILEREPRLVPIINEARGQRAFPGYNHDQTYRALKDRVSRLVGMEAENQAISTTAHYEAVMSTIADLLPLDAAEQSKAPPTEGDEG